MQTDQQSTPAEMLNESERESERGELSSRSRTAYALELSPHLLVVDDDRPLREACCEIARGAGYRTYAAANGHEARERMAQESIDIVLLDWKLPDVIGFALLDEMRAKYPHATVIVTTAFATVNSALEAMRTGAQDYLTKPFSMEELLSVLERASQQRSFDSESRRLRERLRAQAGLGGLVGNSTEMQKLYRIVSKVAFSTHPVLILGESGTGKEMVAHAIHANGPNAKKPFIPVDCGSLVPTLIESELFGYVKGAFTGANQSREGLLSAAEGGTVFLDEIGELPLELQAKLLRALQEKEVRPVGATHAVPISARVLAATNRDLSAMVEQGQFRKDLYFRLNVVNLRIPSLRARKQDIPLLAAHFLERMRRENGVSYTFSDDALRVMTQYEWPGNVRELENAIERACALSSGPVLHMADMPTQLQDFRRHTLRPDTQQIDERIVSVAEVPLRGMASGWEPQSRTGIVSIAEMEKEAILSTIRRLHGDKLMAARLLGIGKTTLYRKLKEYGIADGDEPR